MNEYEGHWIETYTGRKFHFLAPRVEEIDIRDIAHALSLTCRYGGHCRVFYSVAEHSIRVAEIVPEECKLLALLHDAAEAYLVDLPRPIKHILSDYKGIEDATTSIIWRKFVGDWTAIQEYTIKQADNVLIATEARDLMVNTTDWEELPEPLPGRIDPYRCHDIIEDFFLAKFREYCKDWRKY